ncbi:uncharacterized protein MELLADRAFT_96011 [Melampsora larici-populina 98AG31]|uniref:CxC5 like cysteine cluster associated with KDZ domain-containing protein n=1 Tax=Melampsora larici-populina (strain 98AG31 / pathotype 3-4-7) TaxID=747676 RepID=F4SAL1_MELLP|nr:uncharacterized protein MELLADRAFT_96011 [Melampsora larici-populina 98AG31]EGF98317.1 hypothetical protein MELLADRAFT_96011 [Melampsora larici-populina 98AG31]
MGLHREHRDCNISIQRVVVRLIHALDPGTLLQCITRTVDPPASLLLWCIASTVDRPGLTEFVNRLNERHPHLATRLTLANLVQFITLASDVYKRADKALNFTSDDLRLAPFMQLALQLKIEPGEYEHLWTLAFPAIPFAHVDTTNLIRLHGLTKHLTTKVHEAYLVPPTSTCLLCPQASGRGFAKRPRINGYLYGLDGIHSAEFHTWGCLDCGRKYRPSYYTSKVQRVYYSKAQGAHPEHYQVHCHFGITHRLATYFRQAQMLAHISNFNLVNLFNLTHFKGQNVPTHSGLQSEPKISQEVARDAVDLYSLLRRCDRRGSVLYVGARGKNADRLLPAMARELYYIANHGTSHLHHFCSLCVRISKVEHEGKEAVKILCISHPSRSHRWTDDRSLALHGFVGTATGAGSAHRRTSSQRSMPQPITQSQFTILRRARSLFERMVYRPTMYVTGHAWFTDVPRQKSPGIMDRFPSSKEPEFLPEINAEPPGVESAIRPFSDEADRAHEAARDGGEAQPKGTPVLTRSRTHNDQLIVGTCGIILSRRTFYNAEAPSAVRKNH